MTNGLQRRSLWGLAAAIAALAIAGCGSDSSSSGSSTSSGAAATTTKAAAASTGGAPDASALSKLQAVPTSIAITEPLAKKPPTGKHIIFLSCSQPTCPPFMLGLKPAAAALGWTVSSISYKPTPEAEVQAINNAITQKPDGIFVTGLPRSVMEPALKRAQAANIPVVDGYTVNEATAPIIANVANGDTISFAPKAIAAFAAQQTKCKGAVADFTIKTYPILAQQTSVFEATLKQYCPDIKIKQINAQATDVGTKIPSSVTATLQANPDIKLAAFAFGSMTLGVPAAMKAAGLSAQLVGYGADAPTNVESVKVGDEAAETGFGLPYGGWRAMDAFARHFTGADTSIDTTAPNPGRLYVKENSQEPVTWTNLGQPPPDVVAAQFKKLWGVS